MRLALALLVTVVLTAPSVVPAEAQSYRSYPWCAEYGAGNGGRNCGFSTLRQCRAAISGDNSGTCIRSGYGGRSYRTYGYSRYY
jgi:hypothetical protein